MSDSQGNSQQRRAPRSQVARGQVTNVALERTSGSAHDRLTASLVDLSRYGCKLSTPWRIPLGEAIRLEFSVPQLELELNVTAEVCWTRPTDDNSWFLGCSFIPELPEDACDRLGAGGLVERRRQFRHRVFMPATAIWELDPTHRDVTVTDYSRSGFCFLTDNPGQTGHLLTLHLPDLDAPQQAIPARTQWLLKIAEGYLVGCAIINWHEWDFMDAWLDWADNQPIATAKDA